MADVTDLHCGVGGAVLEGQCRKRPADLGAMNVDGKRFYVHKLVDSARAAIGTSLDPASAASFAAVAKDLRLEVGDRALGEQIYLYVPGERVDLAKAKLLDTWLDHGSGTHKATFWKLSAPSAAVVWRQFRSLAMKNG